MSLDECFAILERCATNGERCPVNHPQGSFPNALTSRLAREGRIRIEIFRLNWRVVTILAGPHKGKQTARCPAGGKPYLTVDADGPSRDIGKRRACGLSPPRKFSWDTP